MFYFVWENEEIDEDEMIQKYATFDIIWQIIF